MKQLLSTLALALLFITVSVNGQTQPATAETDETITVDTEMLNVSIAQVPTKSNVIWNVTRNGIEEKDFSFADTTRQVELTIIIEDVKQKGGQQSFYVTENLKKLGKNKAVGKIKIYAIGNSREDFKYRWDKNWETMFFKSFDGAVESFWQNSPALRGALLIVSNRTDSLPENVFDRLKNESGLKSALIYYLVTKPIKRDNKWQLSWSNLSWMNKWLVTLDEKYIDRQFDSFNDMLGNYKMLNVYLGNESRTEIKVTATEAGTGKTLVSQKRIYDRLKGGKKQ